MLNELRYNSTLGRNRIVRVNVRLNAPRVHMKLRNPPTASGRPSNPAPGGGDGGSIDNYTCTSDGGTRCNAAWGLFWTKL